MRFKKIKKEIVKSFKKNLDKYFYKYPYGRDLTEEISFDDFNHDHICFARLLGGNVFREVCPICDIFSQEDSFLGSEDICDSCKYDIRADFCRNEENEPEIKLSCDERLIGYIRKGFYGDYSNK